MAAAVLLLCPPFQNALITIISALNREVANPMHFLIHRMFLSTLCEEEFAPADPWNRGEMRAQPCMRPSNLRVHLYISDAYRALGNAAAAVGPLSTPFPAGFAPKTLVFPSGLGPRHSSLAMRPSRYQVEDGMSIFMSFASKVLIVKHFQFTMKNAQYSM